MLDAAPCVPESAIVQLTRAVATCAALAALGGALGGCGKNGSGRVTKAQAVAYANRTELSDADVPGWIRGSSGGEVKFFPAGIAGARCAGAVDPHRRLIHRYSPLYHQPGDGSMYSEVLVWPTAALAAKSAKAYLSARGLACFRREEPRQRTYKEGDVVVHQVLKSNVRLADPLPRVASSFEFRVTWTNHVPAQPHFESASGRTFAVPAETFTSYEDELGFLVGPAQIYLIAHSAINGMSTTTEQDALSTIYERAERHKL